MIKPADRCWVHAELRAEEADATDPPLPQPGVINLIAMYVGQGLMLGLLFAVPLFHSATFLSAEREELGLVTDQTEDVDEPGSFILDVTADSGTWVVSVQKIFGQYEYQQKIDAAKVTPVTVVYSSLTGSLVAVPELDYDDRDLYSLLWPAAAFAVVVVAALRAFAFYRRPESRAHGIAFAVGFFVLGTPIGLALFESAQEVWQRTS